MSEWVPLSENMPKDAHEVDLWAKRWVAESDQFEYRRFPACWYVSDDINLFLEVKRGWQDLPEGWRPTHYMEIPAGPDK